MAGPVRISQGQVLTPEAVVGTRYLGIRSVTINRTKQKLHVLVPLLRPQRSSQRGADKRKRSILSISMLCEGSCEETGDPQLELGFQFEPGACFAWRRLLSIDEGSRGQGVPLCLPGRVLCLCCLEELRPQPQMLLPALMSSVQSN
jgi:hypothetical protein